MKHPSIQKRIQTSIVLFVSTILGIGSTILYLQIRKSLDEHTNDSLIRTATILAEEIEYGDDGYIEHDWMEAIRPKKDFVQSWDENNQLVHRSPALKNCSLPRFHGEGTKFAFKDVTLPKEHRGRAVGIKVYPSTNSLQQEEIELIKEAVSPQILVVAMDIEDYERRLDRMRWILCAIILGIVTFSTVVIHLIIRNGLLPLEELSHKISEKNIDQLGTGFQIRPDFPMELKGIIHKYNELFARVDRVRIRERDFAAYAAHELRTPLAGLISTLERPGSKARDPEYYKERIKESLIITNSMQLLIERLMTLSRLQNNNTSIEPKQFHLHDTIQEISKSLSDSANKKNIEIKCKLTAGKQRVNQDRHLTLILINNLLSNALSYSGNGSKIIIKTYNNKQRLHLDISNPAPDLNQEDLAKLSEPFYRKDKSRSRNNHHFGMGLAICQEIIRLFEASMEFSIDENHYFHANTSFAIDE